MSNWTHVAAVVRVDDIRIPELSDGDVDFVSVFGKECRFDSPEEVWDNLHDHPDQYLPRGSEGTLHMEVWTNPDLSHCDAYTVTIFGDLRDHDSAQEVISWFKTKLERDPIEGRIRNACIVANNECYGAQSWSYDEAHDA